MRVQEQQQQTSSSDENCNFGSSSLEMVGNEILDNDMIDDINSYSDSSSLSSSISNTTTNGSMDLNSYSDEDAMAPTHDQEDLINQLSYSGSSSKSDPFPESMSSSSESIDQRRFCSPSFSFTSLLLEESDELNGNERPAVTQPETVVTTAPATVASSSSPFTSKIVNMIRRRLN